MTTALRIITSALRKAGVLTMGETPAADDAIDCLEMLNDMIASWSNDSLIVYARTLESFPVVSGTTSYTIGSGGTFDTARPIRIISAYVRSATIDYPLQVINDENYADVGIKSIGGIPQFLNYTNEYPLATINLFPAPTTGYSLFLLTEKQLSEFTLNQTVALPPGWKRALIYNLAMELGPEYGQPTSQGVFNTANESKALLRAAVMAAKPMQWDTGVSSADNIYGGWNN